MKKKIGIILSIAAVVVVGFGIIKFKEYYDNRYVESDIVYVKVPDNQSVELEDMLDDRGKIIGPGKEYSFTGYTEKGESKVVEFTYYVENKTELLQPGQYLKVSSSKTLVLGQEVIPEVNVPTNVQKLLNQ